MKPLIPSLAQGVYINQFTGGDKKIYLFYNARGYTVDEGILQISADAKYHYFDLLHGKEITPKSDAISLKMAADDVAVMPGCQKYFRLVRLPRDGQ